MNKQDIYSYITVKKNELHINYGWPSKTKEKCKLHTDIYFVRPDI